MNMYPLNILFTLCLCLKWLSVLIIAIKGTQQFTIKIKNFKVLPKKFKVFYCVYMLYLGHQQPVFKISVSPLDLHQHTNANNMTTRIQY